MNCAYKHSSVHSRNQQNMMMMNPIMMMMGAMQGGSGRGGFGKQGSNMFSPGMFMGGSGGFGGEEKSQHQPVTATTAPESAN